MASLACHRDARALQGMQIHLADKVHKSALIFLFLIFLFNLKCNPQTNMLVIIMVLLTVVQSEFIG